MVKKTISILLIISGFHAILSLGTNIFLAKNLGLEILGKYNYAVTLGTIAFQCVTFGMDQILVNEYVRSGRQAITKSYIIKLLNFIALFIISIAIYLVFDKSIALLSCSIAISALNMQVIYEIKNKQKEYSYIFFVEKLIFGLIMMLYITGGGDNLLIIFVIYFIVTFGSILYQVLKCRDDFDFRNFWLIDWGMLYSGLSILITSLSKFTFGGLSRIFIKENLGFAALGIFTLIWQFISLVSIYTQQIISVTRLKISESLKVPERNENKKYGIYLIIASIIPAIAFVLLVHIISKIEYFNNLYMSVEQLITLVAIYMLVAALDSFIPMYYIPLKMELIALKYYIILSFICILLMASNFLPNNLYSYILTITATHLMAILIISFLVVKKLKCKL